MQRLVRLVAQPSRHDLLVLSLRVSRTVSSLALRHLKFIALRT